MEVGFGGAGIDGGVPGDLPGPDGISAIEAYEQAAVVLPVVHAFEIAESHVQIGGVIGDLVGKPAAGLEGVGDAALAAQALFRLVERGEQQNEKAHVVIQGQAGGQAAAGAKRAAQAAVAGFITGGALIFQKIRSCGEVSEHIRTFR